MTMGIDFGAKKSGFTVACFGPNPGMLNVKQSEKGKDADHFLFNLIKLHQPQIIAIDAPLSIPHGILGMGKNYSHRACDGQLNAMSPMFLGGLTARAIALKDSIINEFTNVQVIETYPKGLVHEILGQPFIKTYKKEIEEFLANLKKHYNFNLDIMINNWHQVDGLLAFISASRHLDGRSDVYGDPAEGLIYL